MRLIPPVAIPLNVQDVAMSLRDSEDVSTLAFRASLLSAGGFPAIALFGSGRAALASFLSGGRRPDREEVLVPAYACWSIAAAVVRAGLRVRLLDVDPRTLVPDPGSVTPANLGRAAFGVIPHLFARSPAVQDLAARFHAVDGAVAVIDDSAQAWPGAQRSLADAMLLSFGRGKPVPLGGGGAILHRGDREVIVAPVRGGGWGSAASLALTSLIGRPGLFRIPQSLPFLGVGETVYDPGFSLLQPFRGWQVALGNRMIRRLPELTRRRTEHARRILARIETLPSWRIPDVARMEGPIRLPVLAPSAGARDAMIRELRRRGVGASPMYPGTLADIPALRLHWANPDVSLSGAREVAGRLLTLPVYPTLSTEEVDLVANSFELSAGEAGG